MRRILPLLLSLLTGVAAHAAEVVQVSTIPAPEANQAAAADGDFWYAITNTKIAKYSRETGQRVAVSTGEAHHLNSGFLLEGRLYCAHSNFPAKPEKSEIRVLETKTMALTVFKDFGESKGSLTWAVREGDAWWCTFAFYGASNPKTRLVKYDPQWKEIGEWTYPAAVTSDLGGASISGGLWFKGDLLTIGHDKPVLYRLRLPAQGTVLEFVDKVPCPFPGQGIALDPKTGDLIGIDRKAQKIVVGNWRD